MPQTLPPSSSPPPNIYFGMFKVCTALDCVLKIHVISFRDSFHTLRVLQSTLQPPTTLTLLHQYVTNVEFDFQQLIIGHFWSQVLKLGPKDTLLNHWWAKWPLPWFWPSPVPILVFPPEVLPTVANRVFTLPREHILTKHVSPSPATTQWNFLNGAWVCQLWHPLVLCGRSGDVLFATKEDPGCRNGLTDKRDFSHTFYK